MQTPNTARARTPLAVSIRWILAGASVVTLVAGAWLATWTLRNYQFEQIVRDALASLSQGHSALDAQGALAQWRSRTEPYWTERRDELALYVYRNYPLEDARVRSLLATLVGADFGDRIDEWRAWLDNFDRRKRAPPGRTASPGLVRLTHAWSTDIGVVAGFSGLLCLDGDIFAPSLGSAFLTPDDVGNAVVRVDGRSGLAERVFEPGDRAPRDILGIARMDSLIGAACANGFLYAITPKGALRWRAFAGDELVSPPMVADLNSDGTSDAIVATARGRVVAFSGHRGVTMWSQSISAESRLDLRSVPNGERVGVAWLACGRFGDDSEDTVITSTIAGDLRLLSARGGEMRFQETRALGWAPATFLGAELADGAARAWLGDLNGRLSAIERLAGRWSVSQVGAIGGDGVHAVFCAPRSMQLRDDSVLFVALGESTNSEQTAVAALTPAGRLWRLTIPGVACGAPAVADVSGDGEPDLVILLSDRGGLGGRLVILGAHGRTLAEYSLSAAPACGPTIADVTGDGLLEILVADVRGRLHCLSTNGYGVVQWGHAAGDPGNTRNAESAYLFGQSPYGFQWSWRPPKP